jgi:hypothetical protein
MPYSKVKALVSERQQKSQRSGADFGLSYLPDLENCLLFWYNADD